MHRNGLRLCLFVSTVAGLGEGRGDELRFHVEPDARLTRSVQLTHDLTLASVSMTIDGQEVEDLGSDVGLRVHLEYSYVVHDLFEAVAEGQPRKVRRSFEELSGSERQESPDDPEQSHEGDMESKLAGGEVVFTWDEEEQKFVAAFAEGETGEEYLLRGLEEDMDLRALLPAGEVAVGDQWQIELGQDLLSPGGDLRIWDHDEAPDEIAAEDQLRANRHTKVTATYEGTRVEGDVELATIRLQIEGSSSSELSESSGSMRVEDSSKLEGELRWDRTHGHARMLSLEGETRLGVRDTTTNTVEGAAYETSSEFTGEVHLRMDLADG
ncbi:MAG: hypothetical protein EXS08_02405 [Planctomycetes bacterium]|nr:hypothetical protein [Planctomycetota bacterium]